MPYRFILLHFAVKKAKFQVPVTIYLIVSYTSVFISIYPTITGEKYIHKKSLFAF